MVLRVIKPGFHTIAVGRRRIGQRDQGWPSAGAADAALCALGQALVGDTDSQLSLEFTLVGPTFEALAPVTVAVMGTGFSLHRNGVPCEVNRTWHLEPGDTLCIGGSSGNCRGYVCVPGGFHDVVPYTALQAGTVLVCATSRQRQRSLAEWPSWLANQSHVAVLPGPQQSWFDWNAFQSTEWIVGQASNRMGMRLEGMPLHSFGHELLSEPVVQGTIQVANNGLPIVLGVDGQTIGGYPKVAYVVRADLDQLARWQPGQRVRFFQTTLHEATRRTATQQQWLRSMVTRLTQSLQRVSPAKLDEKL
jgi:biotin-dependent carboxylase-like uncharacterized protein